MHIHRLRLSGLFFVIAVVLSLTAALPTEALEKSNLIFYCSFDKEMKPDIAAGRKTTKKVGEPALVKGRFGKALQVQHLKSGLVFDTKKNLPARGKSPSSQGTISFWITPVGWDVNSTDDLLFPLMGTRPEKTRTVLTVQSVWPRNKLGMMVWPYYYPDIDPAGGFPACIMGLADLKGGIEGEATMNLRPGHWYHIVFTWRKEMIQAYSNGDLNGQVKSIQVKAVNLSDSFFVGYGGWEQPCFIDPGCEKLPDVLRGLSKQWKYVIDDLAIFDRALYPSQVRKLYQEKGGAFVYAQKGDTDPVVIETYYYNHKNKLKVKVFNYKPEQVDSVRLEVRGENSIFPLASVGVPFNKIEDQYQILMDVSQLPTVRLEAQAVVVLKNAKSELRSNNSTFNRTIPLWLNNTYGKKDTVLPPWIPVSVGENDTSVWGRRYVWNEDLTPREMHSRKKQLLARPMELRMIQGGKERKFSATGKASSTLSEAKTNNYRRAVGKLGDVAAEVSSTTGFDGFIRWDLRLVPKGKARVDGLFLEIPIKKRHATWFHTSCRRGAKAPTKPISGEFPVDRGFGSGTLTWCIAFHDGEVGFQWAMRSNQYWSNADASKQVNVIPGKDEMVIRLNIIDQPTVINEPVEYSFSFQALPVKKLPRPYGPNDWPHVDKANKVIWDPPIPFERLYRGKFAYGIGFRAFPWDFGEVDKTYEVRHVKHQLHTPGPRPGDFGFTRETAASELEPYYWRPEQKPAQGNMMKYIFMNTIWSSFRDKPYELTDVADIFATDWAISPDMKPGRGRWECFRVCPNEGYRDYLAFWTHKRAMEEIGVYYDHSPPRICSNLEHGHGWIDDKGKVHPIVPIFELRKTQMRAYAAMKEVKPHGMILQHISGTMFMGTNAFCDFVLDGENISRWSDRQRARKEKGGYWSESLFMDYAMTLYNPRPWGVVNLGCWQLYDLLKPGLDVMMDKKVWHVSLRRRLRWKFIRDFRALLFQIGRPDELGAYSIYGAWDNEYPMEDVRRFMGWWEQKAFAGVGPLYLSYWPAPSARNRLMVTVSNLTFTDHTQKISVDPVSILKEAGKKNFTWFNNYKVLTVTNVETGERLPVSGKTFTVKVGKKDYRNLMLQWTLKDPPPRTIKVVPN